MPLNVIAGKVICRVNGMDVVDLIALVLASGVDK
jgi:hypothetical protein